MAYVSNNKRSVATDAGEFLIEQRNVGYEPNDGKWLVSQLPELYWTGYGFLRQRRSGKFLGVFDTLSDANTAIENATVQPVDDEAIRSIGRVSC
jgi:hypothetical protein